MTPQRSQKLVAARAGWRMFLCFCAMLFFSADVHATLFTLITAEKGVVEYNLKTNAVSGWYSEPGSSHRFHLAFKQGERDTTNPVLVATMTCTTNEHYRGKSALEICIAARDEVLSKRAAYKAAIDCVGGHDAFAPPLKPADWFHGFAMKIDAGHYQLPVEGEVLFEQWWQGAPFHPPVAIVIVNPADARARKWGDAGTNGNFALILRDDGHNADENFPGAAQYFDLGPVTTGEWLRWLVHVRPSPVESRGAIDITLNGEEKLKLGGIRVGYNPDNPQYKDHRPPDHIAAVNVALYRLNGQNFQRFFFDEIKFADTREDATVR
jgi:Polysaccharide lyase